MPNGKPGKARLPVARENHDPESKARVDAGELDSDDDLLNRVAAINRALQSWNDQEALRLLRLHWRQISRFVRERA
jgi:hypothetical protein